MYPNLPLISIITPSLNQSQFLEATITSVITQSYPSIEYIIIDGGSTDGSIDIIQKYQRHLAYWISEPDRGQAHAINKGLLRATGDYLGWINSDDTYTPDAICRVAEFFCGNPRVSLAYGSIYYIDNSGRRISSPIPSEGTPVFSAKTMIGDRVIIQPGSFWSRTVMQEVGLLNENYHHVFDYEFWVRIILTKGIIAQIPGKPLANFRLSHGSKTVSYLYKSGEEELELITKLLADPRIFMLNLSPQELRWRTKKAYAIAYLKIYKGLSNQSGNFFAGWPYLVSACRAYPIFLVTRFPLILSVIRDKIFH